jgi:hypothetical protein
MPARPLRSSRHGERQGDAPKGIDAATAIDRRRVFNILGDFAKIGHHHPDRHRQMQGTWVSISAKRDSASPISRKIRYYDPARVSGGIMLKMSVQPRKPPRIHRFQSRRLSE